LRLFSLFSSEFSQFSSYCGLKSRVAGVFCSGGVGLFAYANGAFAYANGVFAYANGAFAAWKSPSSSGFLSPDGRPSGGGWRRALETGKAGGRGHERNGG
jgi:hypothetical protein